MKKRSVVCDTNIFIDIICADLLPAFLNLPYKIFTTSLVIGEIIETAQLEAIQKDISSGRIKKINFSSDDMLNLADLYGEYKNRISLVDFSTWFLAKKENALLLTGDSNLRKLAKADNINVSGTLFIFEELIEKGLLDKNHAILKLNSLCKINRWLPQKEIALAFKRWGKR